MIVINLPHDLWLYDLEIIVLLIEYPNMDNAYAKYYKNKSNNKNDNQKLISSISSEFRIPEKFIAVLDYYIVNDELFARNHLTYLKEKSLLT